MDKAEAGDGGTRSKTCAMQAAAAIFDGWQGIAFGPHRSIPWLYVEEREPGSVRDARDIPAKSFGRQECPRSDLDPRN